MQTYFSDGNSEIAPQTATLLVASNRDGTAFPYCSLYRDIHDGKGPKRNESGQAEDSHSVQYLQGFARPQHPRLGSFR